MTTSARRSASDTVAPPRRRQGPERSSSDETVGSSLRIVVVGGGTAGLACAAALRHQLPPSDSITLIEPSATHYYQPGFTLVGGAGWPLRRVQRAASQLVPSGVAWVQEAVATFDPDRSRLVLADGREMAYDYLIACPGLALDWGRIPGLAEALGDGRVCSIYDAPSAADTATRLRTFQGGRALFTQPPMPVKCPGAPQKIVYLAADQWRRRGVLGRTRLGFVTAADALFSVPEYVPTLEGVAARYGVEVDYRTRLTAVDGPRARASFVRSGEHGAVEWTEPYDLLHVVPPQGPLPVVRASPLADTEGWIDVDPGTLRHRRYANVFGLGDASSAPTSKTAAAVRAQLPVVVANLQAAMAGELPPLEYSGYASCPLITAHGRVVLAEFVYGRKVRPSLPWNSTRERCSAWWLKTRFRRGCYWQRLLKGRAPHHHAGAARPAWPCASGPARPAARGATMAERLRVAGDVANPGERRGGMGEPERRNGQ